MARQQKLIHLHGKSRLTKEAAAKVQMAEGELAVMNGTTETSELYVLTTDGDIATFVTGANVAKQIDAEAAIARAAEKANADAIAAITGEGGSLAATLQAAKEHTNGLLGDGFTTEKTVAAAIAAEAERADAAEKANADAIKTISDDYLKGADKTELQGEIDAAEERIATLEGKFEGENSVAAQIAAAVKAETDRAMLAEKVNADAIDAIEADYLKEADKTELNNLITGLTATVNDNETDIEAKMSDEIERATKEEEELWDAITDHTTNGDVHVTPQQKIDWQAATNAINLFLDDNAVSDDVVSTLKEIQEYINTDGAAADTMTKNIAANAAAIEAIEADYLTSTDKTELQSAIDAKVAQSAYDTKVGELEVADAANTKAINDEKTRAEGAEAALQGEIDAAEERIATLEGKFTGENSVAAQIQAAVKAETDRAMLAEKANADAIDAIEADYLTSTDKTELQDAIDGVEAAYKAADEAFTTALSGATDRIKTIEDNYVQTVSVQNSEYNKITATEVAGVVTMNFDNMVIDCGEY